MHPFGNPRSWNFLLGKVTRGMIFVFTQISILTGSTFECWWWWNLLAAMRFLFLPFRSFHPNMTLQLFNRLWAFLGRSKRNHLVFFWFFSLFSIYIEFFFLGAPLVFPWSFWSIIASKPPDHPLLFCSISFSKFLYLWSSKHVSRIFMAESPCQHSHHPIPFHLNFIWFDKDLEILVFLVTILRVQAISF